MWITIAIMVFAIICMIVSNVSMGKGDEVSKIYYGVSSVVTIILFPVMVFTIMSFLNIEIHLILLIPVVVLILSLILFLSEEINRFCYKVYSFLYYIFALSFIAIVIL